MTTKQRHFLGKQKKIRFLVDQLKTRYIFSRETRAVFTTVALNVSSLIKNETSVTCFIDEPVFTWECTTHCAKP